MHVAPAGCQLLEALDARAIEVNKMELVKRGLHVERLRRTARNLFAGLSRDVRSGPGKCVDVHKLPYDSLLREHCGICRRVVPQDLKLDLTPWADFIEFAFNHLPSPRHAVDRA
jgi:hypothetical protein